jgi:hypothetical protein
MTEFFSFILFLGNDFMVKLLADFSMNILWLHVSLFQNS